MCCSHRLCYLLLAGLLSVHQAPRAHAQAGLREALEKLDRDEDGRIDPEEITPLARPYLERIAESRRLSLERSNGIDTLQEAARVYHALKNGVAGRDVRPEPSYGIRSFRQDDEEPLVPEFGLGEIRYPMLADDLEEAERTLRRSDRDGDGFIDRREAYRAEWTHRNPFADDYDKDDRLSRLELAQRYARRRLLSNDSSELIQRARRVGNGVTPSARRDDDDDRDRSRWWRGGSNSWLTGNIMERFDENRNGRLESQEVKLLGLPSGQIDIDRDGELSRSELQEYLEQAQESAGGNAAEGIPGWFYELDVDRDGQIAMAEYTQDWTAAKLDEFAALDVNDDGLLTAEEVANAKGLLGGSYANETATVLAPNKTIVSEIEISEAFEIRDLNLQLSITHSNVGDLDAFLNTPDGQRIELFTEVGGSGNHFEDTVFSDEAQTPIVKGRPPYEGEYIPEGLVKKQPGLGSMRGKSAEGVWQLVIRGTRSERFGMLHNWRLMFQAEEKMPGELLTQRPSVEEDSAAEGAAGAGNEGAAARASNVITATVEAQATSAGASLGQDASGNDAERAERRQRLAQLKEQIESLRNRKDTIDPIELQEIKEQWAQLKPSDVPRTASRESRDLPQNEG